MKRKKQNGKIILSIVMICFLLILIFPLRQKENNYIKETNDSEVTFAYVVEGAKQNTIPSKEGYTFDTENSSCTNGVTISWNYSNWNAKISNLKNTKSNCILYFKKEYGEKILNGALPEIKGDLVPVTIDNGVVRKADLSSEWYSYQNKRWANAVILIDKTKEYKNNEEIKEENIESYFVWIPRYRYQLKENESTYVDYNTLISKGSVKNNSTVPNTGANSPFEIIFEDKNTTRITENTQNGWLSHPAFASFNSNGMWVGKFETGYNQNENINSLITNTEGWTMTNAQQNIKDSSKIIIKPNVYSWRNIQVANAFYTSFEYMRSLDSHMMKNMEWGAITYLAYSKYGRCNNGSCEEVRNNNNSNFITGYSANFEPSCGLTNSNEECNKYDVGILLNTDGDNGWNYKNPSSQVASTTGNYTGIYDMAGGSWEYVMGIMKSLNNTPSSGRNEQYHSYFNGDYSCPTCDQKSTTSFNNGYSFPTSKYYDLYDNNGDNKQFQRGYLGDATKELGPYYEVTYDYNMKPTRRLSSWFADRAYFVNRDSPYFERGGDYSGGSEFGISAFDNAYGSAYNCDTFRIVLMPN